MCKQGCCDVARTPTTEELVRAVHVDAWMHYVDPHNLHYLRYGMLLGLWLAGRDDVMFELMKDRDGVSDMGTLRDLLAICHRRMMNEDNPMPGLFERLSEAEQWATNHDKRGGGA